MAGEKDFIYCLYLYPDEELLNFMLLRTPLFDLTDSLVHSTAKS